MLTAQKNRQLCKRQHGQSFVEMLIALPLLLMLIFGIIQWGFIYRSKITLNTSTELAARSGALNFGQRSVINRAFAQGMVPLFMQGDASLNGIVAANIKARIAVAAQARLTILNPSSGVWNRFNRRVIYPLEGRNGTVRNEILNDNLMFRPSTQQILNGGVRMNIQDANLLKIQVDWCEELIVPVIGGLIVQAASGIIASAEQLRCNGVARARGKPLLAMQSIATYRMQTPFRNR